MGEERLLHDGGDGVAERGAEDQQHRQADLDIEPLAERDQADPGEGEGGACPGQPTEALAQQQHGQQSRHDRIGVDDETRRARRHDLLSDVEQHRIALENLKWMIEDLTRQVEEQTLQHLLEANDRVKAESDDSILEFVMNTWLDDSFSSVSKESEQMSEVEDLDSSVTLPIDFFDIPAAISLTEDPISLSGLEGNINDEELDVHHIACEREAESPFQVFDLTVVSPEATSQVDRDVSIPANEAAASVPVSDNELARQNVGPAFTSSGRVAELTMERTSTLKSRIVKTFSQFKNYTQRIMLGLWCYVTGWWRQIIR